MRLKKYSKRKHPLFTVTAAQESILKEVKQKIIEKYQTIKKGNQIQVSPYPSVTSLFRLVTDMDIDDEIMHNFMQLLLAKTTDFAFIDTLIKKNSTDPIPFLTSDLVTQRRTELHEKRKIEKAKKFWLWPYNIPKVHWVLVKFDINAKKYTLFDSLKGFVNDETLQADTAFIINEASKETYRRENDYTVQQPDSFNCGIFALLRMYALVNNKDFKTVYQTKQIPEKEYLQKSRMWILAQILLQKAQSTFTDSELQESANKFIDKLQSATEVVEEETPLAVSLPPKKAALSALSALSALAAPRAKTAKSSRIDVKKGKHLLELKRCECFLDPHRSCGSYARSKLAYDRELLVSVAEKCGIPTNLSMDSLCLAIKDKFYRQKTNNRIVEFFEGKHLPGIGETVDEIIQSGLLNIGYIDLLLPIPRRMLEPLGYQVQYSANLLTRERLQQLQNNPAALQKYESVVLAMQKKLLDTKVSEKLKERIRVSAYCVSPGLIDYPNQVNAKQIDALLSREPSPTIQSPTVKQSIVPGKPVLPKQSSRIKIIEGTNILDTTQDVIVIPADYLPTNEPKRDQERQDLWDVKEQIEDEKKILLDTLHTVEFINATPEGQVTTDKQIIFKTNKVDLKTNNVDLKTTYQELFTLIPPDSNLAIAPIALRKCMNSHIKNKKKEEKIQEILTQLFDALSAQTHSVWIYAKEGKEFKVVNNFYEEYKKLLRFTPKNKKYVSYK